MCALGNTRVAHALCSHVDPSQLLFAIESPELPGPLRAGYYELLLAVHLEQGVRARASMSAEFIVPMDEASRSVALFPGPGRVPGPPGVGLRACLRPRPHFAEPCFVRPPDGRALLGPAIPLRALGRRAIRMLREAVEGGGPHARDPVGGSVEFLCSTLIQKSHFSSQTDPGMLAFSSFPKSNLCNLWANGSNPWEPGAALIWVEIEAILVLPFQLKPAGARGPAVTPCISFLTRFPCTGAAGLTSDMPAGAPGLPPSLTPLLEHQRGIHPGWVYRHGAAAQRPSAFPYMVPSGLLRCQGPGTFAVRVFTGPVLRGVCWKRQRGGAGKGMVLRREAGSTSPV